MTEMTSGLVARRVCGGIELGFGILYAISSFVSFNIIAILFGVFVIATGVLGILSKTRQLVIAYLVTGIFLAFFMALSFILALVALVAYLGSGARDPETDGVAIAVLILSMILTAVLTIVAILGAVFSGRPLCGNSQE